MPTITSVHPLRAVEGGRITIFGSTFSVDDVTTVQIGEAAARVAFASSSRLVVIIPAELEGGRAAMKVPGATLETAYVTIGARWATGLHQVDNPVFDDGSHEQVASDLGVACGIAFDAEGSMYVGERSGTVFRVRDGRAAPFATIPASVAAFHLAMSHEQHLFVTAPTLNAYDYIYRIDRKGEVHTLPCPLGRPQGLAFAPDGALHVVDALAGGSGVYRFRDLEAKPELVVSGTALVGVAFGPSGEMVVASNETAYRFE